MAIFFVSNFININSALAAVDNIISFVFTTEQRSAGINEISEQISVQAQNSSNKGEQMGISGGKITLTSANGGIFFTATTSEAISTPLTVNSNWMGRNFYYKNSQAGTDTITAILDVGGKSWTATQNIAIGSTIDPPIIPPTPTSTPTTTIPIASSTTPNTNPTIIYSVHYISEDLSDYTEPTTFEISAGRERLGYINSPVSFVAKNKVSKDLQNTKCNYVWNFGDGISEPGEKVEHIYKYAGDYNVILNGVCGNWRAISRTTIKIVEAKILMGKKEDGAIEISNQGKYEINLFDWKISAGNLNYSFPMDTIISAGKSVTFPAEYLKIPTASNDVILADVSGKENGRVNLKSQISNIKDSAKIITVADFEKFAVEYKRLNQVNNKIAVNIVSPYTQIATSSTDSNIILAASVADAVISGDGSSFGFWSKLFHPVRTIKDTFYK